MKRGVIEGLLPLALGACTVYGKVQNPEPAIDLQAPLRIESVLRSTHTFDGTPALQVRIWITPPKGTTLVLADSGIELNTGLAPAGRVARGELRVDDGARVREVRVPSGAEQGVTAFLPLPDDRLRAGADFKLTVAWRLESSAEPAIARPGLSRAYDVRVQRTNYGLVLGIGWLLGGTVVAVVGPE